MTSLGLRNGHLFVLHIGDHLLAIYIYIYICYDVLLYDNNNDFLFMRIIDKDIVT